MLSMIMLAMCLMTGCGARAERTIVSFSDLEEKRIGVTTGSVQALQTEERFPNAEIHYFGADADMLEAMRKGKIDAYASAEALVKYMMAENPDLTCLDEYLSTGIKAGAVFPKTDSGRKAFIIPNSPMKADP